MKDHLAFVKCNKKSWGATALTMFKN